MWISRTRIAWLWTSLICAACWTPKRLMPEEDKTSIPFLVPNFDKLVHFSLFAGFAFFWLFAGRIRPRWVVVTGVALTALTEIGQLLPIVNRDATWPDAGADLLGLVGGLGLAALGRLLFPKFWRPSEPVEQPT